MCSKAPFDFSYAFNPYPDPTNFVRVRTADTLDNEFRYYSKLVEDLTLLLTKQEDREAVPPWVHKLSSPGYNIVPLRDKRNRYMLMLCLSMIADSVEGPFIISPPTGTLTDLTKISPPTFQPFDWELDKTWEDEVANFRAVQKENGEAKLSKKCPFHRKFCPKDSTLDRNIGKVLDKQFRFLLYIARPYAALLFRSSDKLRAVKWIQTLCQIDNNGCAIAKGVRNDYMMVLVGYLSNRCMIGPFQEFPHELLPLPKIAKMYAVAQPVIDPAQPITDPTHPRTAEFFRDMPIPEEGAFALITCNGDMYEPKY